VRQLNWPAVGDDGNRGAFLRLDILLLLRPTAATSGGALLRVL
jgi:hypothetical protein